MKFDLPVRHGFENDHLAADVAAVSQTSAVLSSGSQACTAASNSCRITAGNSNGFSMTAVRDLPVARSDCTPKDSSLSSGVFSDFSSRSASAFALGAADLALSVSLHCARSRSDQPPQLLCESNSSTRHTAQGQQSAVNLTSAACTVAHRQITAAAATSVDGSRPRDGSNCHAVSSREAAAKDVASTSWKTSAADAERVSDCVGRPRDLVEASRARRIDPRDLMLTVPSSAAPWALSACEAELESATLALSRAVASLSCSSSGTRSYYTERPSPTGSCGFPPTVEEDVWVPAAQASAGGRDETASAATASWRDAVAAEASAAAAAVQWAFVGEHPLVANLMPYTASGCYSSVAAEPLDGSGKGIPSRELLANGRPDFECRNLSLLADQLPSTSASPRVLSGPESSDGLRRASVSRIVGSEFPAFATENYAASVYQAVATLPRTDASRPRCRPSSAGANLSSRIIDSDPGRPPQRPSSAAHGSLGRRSRKSSMPLLQHPLAIADRNRPESIHSSARCSLSADRAEPGSSAAAAVECCCDRKTSVTGQRRSFSGFGGGFVSFLERMGRSLSSTDRLRRVSLDGGNGSLRSGAVAAVESEACARRLSEAIDSGSARCCTSSPDLSCRLSKKGATGVARSCSVSMRRTAELPAWSPARVAVHDAARESHTSSIAGGKAGSTDCHSDGSTGAPSGLWQMASDRCDALLSLLAEKTTTDTSAHDVPSSSALSIVTTAMPLSRQTSIHRPTSGSVRLPASPAPSNTHLLQGVTASSSLVTLPPEMVAAMADDCSGVGSGSTADAAAASGAASSAELPVYCWRPAVMLHKPLSSTPARASLIMNELVQTEADYVAALRLIVDHYLPACEYAAPAEPLHGQVAAVFGNVEDLYEFHSHHFFRELCRCQHDPFSVGRIFLDHKQHFEAYALYIKNKPRSDAVMSLHGAQFFKARQEQLADQLDLGSYLLKPIQRLGKYALIVQQLVKECSVWVEAAACAPDAGCLLEGLRQAEDMLRFCLRHGDDLLALESLHDCDLDIASQGQLLRQEQMTVTRDKKRLQRQVFLFEKVVVFSKIKKVEKGHDIYKYKESVLMRDVGLTESVGNTGVRFELWCRGSNGRGLSWIVDASSPQSKQSWVDDIGRLLWRQAAISRQLVLAGRSQVLTKLRCPVRPTGTTSAAAEGSSAAECRELAHRYHHSAVSGNGSVTTVNGSDGGSVHSTPVKTASLGSSRGEHSTLSGELRQMCSPDPWTKIAETVTAPTSASAAGVAC